MPRMSWKILPIETDDNRHAQSSWLCKQNKFFQSNWGRTPALSTAHQKAKPFQKRGLEKCLQHHIPLSEENWALTATDSTARITWVHTNISVATTKQKYVFQHQNTNYNTLLSEATF